MRKFDTETFIAVEDTNRLKTIAQEMLALLGETPQREGLLDTPKRFSKAMEFLTSGYRTDIDELVGNALFNEPSGELVLVKDIEFYSLCEHHLLPFFGKAHVAYIPNGKVIGLSKIPRIIDAISRKLQVQEKFTYEVAYELERILNAKGVAVITEASHLCMMMRGVKKQLSSTITKTMLGDFKTDKELRLELNTLLNT